MKVHHLNCGTMRMPGAPLVCHVLLLETPAGLALVDSGFGLGDVADPKGRIGTYRHVIRPVLDPEEAAVNQIRRLGFDPSDVRDIVLTHLDYDHIGGAGDFPHARVHVTATEATAALTRPTFIEGRRYEKAQWAARRELVRHQPGGETWHGFTGVTALEEVGPDVLLIPMPGHTRGHAAIAVDAGDHWVLHAGDAFYHQGTLDGKSTVPLLLRAQERLITFDWKLVKQNHTRLAELQSASGPGLRIVNAHDPHGFRQAVQADQS